MANWYSFSGCCDGVYDPMQYRKLTIKPLCNLGAQICAIYLVDSTTIPGAFNSMTEQYIANALATQTAQPVGVGVKRFVYLKGPIS